MAANTAGGGNTTQGHNPNQQAPFQASGLANINGLNILNTTSNNGISGSFGKMGGVHQNPNMTLATAGGQSTNHAHPPQFSSSHDHHSNMMVTAYNNMNNSSRVMTSENPNQNNAEYGTGMMLTGGITRKNAQS